MKRVFWRAQVYVAGALGLAFLASRYYGVPLVVPLIVIFLVMAVVYFVGITQVWTQEEKERSRR
jgi:uncharacterized membrane protein